MRGTRFDGGLGVVSRRGPLLRWAGSKRRLLPLLSQYWNSSFTKYVEPFAGSAALYFRLQPPVAVLSDINSELILTLKGVQRSPAAVSRILSKWQPDKETYYRLRSIDPEKLSKSGRAARFIFLNKLSFNGLYRTNLSGVFNVPFSGSKTGSLPTAESLNDYSKALSRTKLVAKDFEAVVKTEATKGAFVYLDPPYFLTSAQVFTEYNSSPFCSDDLDRLERTLTLLHRRGAHFLLSYQKTAEIADRFRKWNQKSVRLHRNVSGFAGYRRSTTELLISNVFLP